MTEPENLENLSGLLERSGAPSLQWFVRGQVGMDRVAAQTAFSKFLNDRSLTATQIHFVELIIDQLTSRGVMEAEALYETPFSNLHHGGPEGLFAGKENVMAGTDCGFDTSAGMGRVAEEVVWAKLRALSDGARIASARLFR
jgi:type I restriction enzyme, R subunit